VDLTAYQEAQRKHYRRNYLTLLLDTSTYATVSRVLNPTVTLAYFLSFFTTSGLAVGLIPAILTLGGMVSQLFWANFMARTQRKQAAWIIGTIISRGSMLLFLASAALATGKNPVLPVSVFYLALTVYAFSNGLVGPLWANFVAKVFPTARGRFLGLAYFVDACTSLAATAGLRWILDNYAFPQGFIYFFSLLAVFAIISILPSVLFKEVPYPIPDQAQPIMQTLREIPAIIQGYPSYARYVACRIVVTFAEMAAQFFTLHAVTQLKATGSHVAIYSMLIVGGGLMANLLWGWVGDRIGFIRVFQITFAIGGVMLALVLTAHSPVALYPVFLLQGIYGQGITLSVVNLNMATSPPERTPLFVALSNAVTGPFLTLTPLIGAGLSAVFGYQSLLWFCLSVYVVDIVLATWAARAPHFGEANLAPSTCD
jgi:MFS family permease